MKRYLVLSGFSVSLLLLAFFMTSQASAVENATNTTVPPVAFVDVRAEACPIMGGPPQEKVATIHQGKVYHFCCGGCIADFQRDPQAAIQKLSAVKEVPLTVTNPNGLCPISGRPASESVFLVRGEFITFYCCPDCIGKDPLPKGTTTGTPEPVPVPPAPK